MGCSPKQVKAANNMCCNSDDALRQQLLRIFNITQPCSGSCVIAWDCVREQFKCTAATGGGSGVPVSLISGPNVSLPGQNGIIITQSGSAFKLQLNTFGINPGTVYTGVNGVTVSGSDIGLGGALTPNISTLIAGSVNPADFTEISWGNNVFPITNFNLTAQCLFLEVGDNGQLSDGDWVLSRNAAPGGKHCAVWRQLGTGGVVLTPTNGVQFLSGTNFGLGGSLTQNTAINGVAAYDFSYQNIDSFIVDAQTISFTINGNPGAPGDVLSIDGLGNQVWAPVSVPPPINYVGDNGITVAGATIKMGGVLTAPVTVVDGTNLLDFTYKDIKILDLQGERIKMRVNGSYGLVGEVPIADGAGNWFWGPVTLPPGVVTASNGLTALANNVTLGGTLSQPSTTIFGANNALYFNAISTYKVEATTLTLQINGTTGNIGDVLTVTGATSAEWQPNAAVSPVYTVVGNATYNVLPTDQVLILDAPAVSNVLPAAIDRKMYTFTPKNNGATHEIVPNGTDVIYEGGTVYTNGSPLVMTADTPVTILGVSVLGSNYWIVTSR